MSALVSLDHYSILLKPTETATRTSPAVMEPFSVPRWPDNFPLAGAIYIEYLAKRGHYITPQDSLEALDRNKHPRSGHMLERYQGKIKWLDQHSSNYKMSRHTMDAITSGGDIDLKYNPRTENLCDSIQSVRGRQSC